MGQGPRTMNAMRKEEMVKEMDPERVKVLEWVSINYYHEVSVRFRKKSKS